MEEDEMGKRRNNNVVAAGGESAIPRESRRWQAMLPGTAGLLELFSLIDTNGPTSLRFYEAFYLALGGPGPPWHTLLESSGTLRLVTLRKKRFFTVPGRTFWHWQCANFPLWCFLTQTCSCLHFWSDSVWMKINLNDDSAQRDGTESGFRTGFPLQSLNHPGTFF